MQGFREVRRKEVFEMFTSEVFVRVRAMQVGNADCSVYTNNCLLQVVTRN